MKNLFCVLTAVFLSQSLAFAAESDSSVGAVSEVSNDSLQVSEPRSKIESWYTYWGLGYSRPSYTGALGDTLQEFKDSSSISNIGINLDLFGFYWPVNHHQTALGMILSVVGDRYSSSNSFKNVSYATQVNQYTLSFSTMHFFHSNIGDGFFVRGDVGPSWAAIVSEANIAGFKGTNTSGSSIGFGGLAGLGYALPLGKGGTRLLFTASYAYRKAAMDDFIATNESGTFDIETVGGSTFSLTGGVMF